MSKLPKYVLVAGYNNFRKHKDILQIFKDYCEMVPHVIHTEDTWFNEQDYYVLPDYIGFNRVLDCIDKYINNNRIFRYGYYTHSYNPFKKIHTYYTVYPLDIGIKLPSCIDITSDDVHKLALLKED